jgi:hypothetical protein
MNAPQTFRELDDLVLDLKGLVLVRDIRRRASADEEELALYAGEIERVRNRLADLMKKGGADRRPAQTPTRLRKATDLATLSEPEGGRLDTAS